MPQKADKDILQLLRIEKERKDNEIPINKRGRF